MLRFTEGKSLAGKPECNSELRIARLRAGIYEGDKLNVKYFHGSSPAEVARAFGERQSAATPPLAADCAILRIAGRSKKRSSSTAGPVAPEVRAAEDATLVALSLQTNVGWPKGEASSPGGCGSRGSKTRSHCSEAESTPSRELFASCGTLAYLCSEVNLKHEWITTLFSGFVPSPKPSRWVGRSNASTSARVPTAS